ncbi:MAG: hypothetical protein AAGG72_09135 [Pseudomonadota bacterium]
MLCTTTLITSAKATGAQAGGLAPALLLEDSALEQLVIPVHHTKKYRKRRGRGDYVDAPYTYVDEYGYEVDAPYTRVRRRGRVAVDAPFAQVRRSRRGVRVRAPFVDLYIPR